MNTLIRRIALFLASAIIVPVSASATTVGTGLIHQPAYLGKASEPGRIPLAPVIFNANYGYGSHSAIFQSRPCYHGHFSDRGAPIYEQNLAVLFGISADFSDSTQLQGSTLTMRLGKCQPPSNAPYTQEQVLAASLQCVLNTCHGLRKSAPLNVVIEGKGIPTPEWASKYTKAYYTDEATDKAPAALIVLPGLKMEETPLGASYVVFDSVPPDPGFTRREPVFVPFLPEGESEAETVALIPVWHGDEWGEPLNVLSLPYMPYYEKWHMGVYGRNAESVAIAHMTPPNPVCRRGNCDVRRSDEGVQIQFSETDLRPYDMAVMICAYVVSERPSLRQPMTVAIAPGSFSAGYRELLKADPSWKEGVSCEFAIDPVGLKLLKGGVPGFELLKVNGRLVVSRLEGNQPQRTDDPLPSWVAGTVSYIRDKAPAVESGKLEEIKKRPDLLRYSPPSGDVAAHEAMIRSLLVIWKFDDSPTMLENVWYSSNDRNMRALAAAMMHAKQLPTSQNPEKRFDVERECGRFEPWEAGLRHEERNYVISYAIHEALKAWEARIAETGKPAEEKALPPIPIPIVPARFVIPDDIPDPPDSTDDKPNSRNKPALVSPAALNRIFKESEAAFEAKDYRKAAALTQELLDSMRSYPGGIPERLYFNSGVANLLAGRLSEAEAAFKECIKRYPQGMDTSRAYMGLGKSCMLQKTVDKKAEAIAAFKMAAKDPEQKDKAEMLIKEVSASAPPAVDPAEKRQGSP